MDRKQHLQALHRCLNSEGGKLLMTELENELSPVQIARVGETAHDVTIRATRRDVFAYMKSLMRGDHIDG
jgi:hypothetical protein